MCQIPGFYVQTQASVVVHGVESRIVRTFKGGSVADFRIAGVGGVVPDIFDQFAGKLVHRRGALARAFSAAGLFQGGHKWGSLAEISSSREWLEGRSAKYWCMGWRIMGCLWSAGLHRPLLPGAWLLQRSCPPGSGRNATGTGCSRRSGSSWADKPKPDCLPGE